MEASEWDHATLREEEFEQHAVYLVPDVSASPGDTNRAEASLPRNLVLKPSQALNDVRSSAKESFLETSSVRVASVINDFSPTPFPELGPETTPLNSGKTKYSFSIGRLIVPNLKGESNLTERHNELINLPSCMT